MPSSQYRTEVYPSYIGTLGFKELGPEFLVEVPIHNFVLLLPVSVNNFSDILIPTFGSWFQ